MSCCTTSLNHYHVRSTSLSNPHPSKDVEDPNRRDSLDTVGSTPFKATPTSPPMASKPIPYFPN